MSADFLNQHHFKTEDKECTFINMRNSCIVGYRVKTIKAGDLLDSEIYPIWNTRNRVYRKAVAKRKPSRTAQENLNHENQKKEAARLLNENFNPGDIWATFGYDDMHIPETWEEANRDIVNFFRRMNRKRKKMGLPPLKYYYRTEMFTEAGKPCRPHHHIVMSGDMSRDEIEKIWDGGGRNQLRKMVPDDYGFTGIARYMNKCKARYRRGGQSLGLKKPMPTYADHKVTKRKVEYIAMNENEAKAIFENLYVGYWFSDIKTKFSDFVPGAYIYVRMRRGDRRLKR